MKNTITNILTNSDIQRINAYIMDKLDLYKGEEIEDRLMRAVYNSIKGEKIETQLVIYTVLTSGAKNIAAKSLGVSVQTIINYMNKWLGNVRADKEMLYLFKEYKEWLAERENAEYTPIIYFISEKK